MSKNSEAVKRWRRNAKARLIRAFGGSCGVCGYNKCDEVMEFHHVNPSEKETQWSNLRGNIKGWNTIVEEMKKCVMLCSNCHKEYHAGVLQLPPDITRLDPSCLDYKAKERKQFVTYCPVCGDEKSLQHKTCGKEACRQTTRVRIVDWSKIDIVALYDQYKNFTVIGDMLGVSGAAVSRIYKRTMGVKL